MQSDVRAVKEIIQGRVPDDVSSAPLKLGRRVSELILWMVGRTLEKKHSWTEGLVQTKAQTGLVCCRVRKIGACGWTPLVRSKEEMELGGDQDFGTLGRNFDHKSSEKPWESY